MRAFIINIPWQGYLAATLGIAAVSAVIGAIESFAHLENVSLLYLLVVLWLAVSFGRGPAIYASALAFLVFDFFFIPPLHHFSVAEPAQWIALFVLLVTALVIGQLTSTVQARAREARESQQRTAQLYALAQLIASAADQQELYDALVREVMQVFAPAGVRACALVLLDARRHPTPQAAIWSDERFKDALSLGNREQAAQAAWALEHGVCVGGPLASAPEGAAHLDHYSYLVPLKSGEAIVGLLGIAGEARLRHLVGGQGTPPQGHGIATAMYGDEHGIPNAALFAAFRGQIALALERDALQHQAIHNEALQESDRLKTALLGSVTHELRTPLASIKAAVSSLLESEMRWSEEQRREFLDSIDESADRLHRLVSNLLDLSRLEAGVATPEKQWYPLANVVETVLSRLELAGQLAGREIAVDLPADLPLVLMDHAQIEQVLTNLLENALKYSAPGSPIAVAAQVVDDSAERAALKVSVADCGIGIPAGELAAIFDKFYRVQRAPDPLLGPRLPLGTGLGLAICAGLIQAHGGRIWAESEPGKGSTFAFLLPLDADAPQGSLPEIEADTPAVTEMPRAAFALGEVGEGCA